MKIAVTGSKGQVATALKKCHGRDGIEIASIARPEFDLGAPDNALEVLQRHRPDIVVNAAAYTQVDRAESERDLAFLINAVGAEAVAAAAARLDIPVIQISTDYVFSGDKQEPYVETDPTEPINAYGASKLEGERLVAAANSKHVILRTSWVYSETGSNFLKTMVRLATEREEVRVVDDQFGAPTHADDIASGILSLARALSLPRQHRSHFGTFHFSAAGVTSWCGFAKAIFDEIANLGSFAPNLISVGSADYESVAKRPNFSVLSNKKIEREYLVQNKNWEGQVRHTTRELLLPSGTISGQ